MPVPSQDFPAQVQRLIDDPLAMARVAAQSGKRVVGYVGNDVPVPLIVAADALPVRLYGITGRTTARADEFLETAHRPEMRDLVEQWLGGAFDFMDAVVFPRSDDSAQRIYYYLCELQRRRLCGGPRPLLFDVASIARSTSSEYTLESTRRLARELGSRGSLLEHALQRVTRRESWLSEIRARRTQVAPLPGGVAWRITRASACDWSEEFDLALQRWLATAPRVDAPRRLMLAGDPLAEDSLHRAIEAVGGSVVLELTDSDTSMLIAQSDPLAAIATQFHARRSPVLAMRQDSEWLADRARAARADGVVLWLIEEDEALPWEIARQMRRLRADLPVLLLSRQCWRAEAGAIQQVRDFVAGLELKK
jgi:hypothetical protein